MKLHIIDIIQQETVDIIHPWSRNTSRMFITVYTYTHYDSPFSTDYQLLSTIINYDYLLSTIFNHDQLMSTITSNHEATRFSSTLPHLVSGCPSVTLLRLYPYSWMYPEFPGRVKPCVVAPDIAGSGSLTPLPWWMSPGTSSGDAHVTVSSMDSHMVVSQYQTKNG